MPNSISVSDCWKLEPHERPSFAQLIERLEELRRTCSTLEDESFHSMQEGWRQEIHDLFSNLKNLENELRAKEEHLRNKEQEQEAKEEMLRQREEALREREVLVIEKELQLLLKIPHHPPPHPRRNRGLNKDMLRNFVGSQLPSDIIGMPKGK